jgi:hypothetical protein
MPDDIAAHVNKTLPNKKHLKYKSRISYTGVSKCNMISHIRQPSSQSSIFRKFFISTTLHVMETEAPLQDLPRGPS